MTRAFVLVLWALCTSGCTALLVSGGDSGASDARPADAADAGIPADVPEDVPTADAPWPFDAPDDAVRADARADVVTVDATPDAAADAWRIETGADTLADAVLRDASSEVSRDAADADPGLLCGPGRVCRAYWCGCGRCDPAAITCVADDRVCPLACPVMACPELAATVCTCGADGVCQKTVAADAGREAGVLNDPCTRNEECGSGLLCCYPCGIPGCSNRCLQPMNGHCPLFP